MPLGRETECARIDALLEEARQGNSGALVLRGEAGVGKSTLLEYARDAADGMTVLSGRSVETEAELALAGLSQILWPILSLSESLPAPQRAALEAGLGQGPQLAPGNRFALYAWPTTPIGSTDPPPKRSPSPPAGWVKKGWR